VLVKSSERRRYEGTTGWGGGYTGGVVFKVDAGTKARAIQGGVPKQKRKFIEASPDRRPEPPVKRYKVKGKLTGVERASGEIERRNRQNTNGLEKRDIKNTLLREEKKKKEKKSELNKEKFNRKGGFLTPESRRKINEGANEKRTEN